jgi:GDP-4-dehydro-6-deoxy-D-mannose reductase
MSRPVLVTGATGMVGRWLVPALVAAGHEVVAVARRPAPGVAACDLADRHATDDLVRAIAPRTLVHLAGGTAEGLPALYRANVLTTVQVLEAVAERVPGCYVVVLGSAAEYGQGGGRPIDEEAPPRPVTAYGRAKLAQTALAQALAADRGLALTVLRPFNLVAPDLSPKTALGNVARQLLAGGASPEVRCGRLDVVRDFVPLPLLAAAVEALLAAPRPGETFNVCTGVPLAVSDVVAAMGRRLGVTPRLLPEVELAAVPAADRVVGDPSRLRSLLGRSPETSADEVAALVLGR